MRAIDALLFDKDGTLFDFAATWTVFAERLLVRLAEGETRAAAAQALRFDLAARRFLPDSPAIAGTNAEIAALLAEVLPETSETLEHIIISEAARAPLAQAVPLAPLLDGFLAQGLRLGVMTNDTEAVAQAHLETVGVRDRFAFVAGADSGFGAKPDPAPLLAFARALDLDPARVAMIGDSTHDLIAGRAAGMACIGVLTGMAGPEVLGPLADAVFPDIGHLPRWLEA